MNSEAVTLWVRCMALIEVAQGDYHDVRVAAKGQNDLLPNTATAWLERVALRRGHKGRHNAAARLRAVRAGGKLRRPNRLRLDALWTISRYIERHGRLPRTAGYLRPAGVAPRRLAAWRVEATGALAELRALAC